MIKKIAAGLGYSIISTSSYEQLKGSYEQLKGSYEQLKGSIGSYPPGHYYSTIPNYDEILKNSEKYIFFSENRDEALLTEGIFIDDSLLVENMINMQPFLNEFPKDYLEKKSSLRFYLNNISYEYTDAAVYYSLLRLLKPKRVIEIGSGFSSALALDVNDNHLQNKVHFTFIEPNPGDRLYGLLNEKDYENVTIHNSVVQDIPLDTFKTLEAGDILFIDSTHVSKIGSDVNYEIFDILPSLNPGVFIHFHDIFYPFVYPESWLKRAWNEAYILRAFLMHNTQYSIEFFNTYAAKKLEDHWSKTLPDFRINTGGSLWLKKL